MGWNAIACNVWDCGRGREWESRSWEQGERSITVPVSGRAGGLTGVADSELSALFASMVRARRVPGAQFALYRNGRRTAAAAGEAEYGSGRRVTGDLAFPIGSI